MMIARYILSLEIRKKRLNCDFNFHHVLLVSGAVVLVFDLRVWLTDYLHVYS